MKKKNKKYKEIDILVEGATDKQANKILDSIIKLVSKMGLKMGGEIKSTDDKEITRKTVI